ncbi:thiol-disulfide oxidoreductase lto1 [Quercus suber]|uniref:Thiol-disulfide oxidoreductase lto1 n=1 Tax=Quercus suber TaxID=58331 RepID=A0AAW0KMM4_QUESU
MASLVSFSSPSSFVSRSRYDYFSQSQGRIDFVKNGWSLGPSPRPVVLSVNCLSPGPGQDSESEPETTASAIATNWTDKLCAGLGGLGFVETTYLTYLKLTNSDAFCPIGGGSCGDILNSDYAVVFGIHSKPFQLFIRITYLNLFSLFLFHVYISSLAEIDLPYFTTEITTTSSPFAVSLAKHLNSIGAKMYGAFWCSHCLEQKQTFGQEAAKLLDYVECFPDGYRKGTKMAKACTDAKIEGFPMWEINGQVLSGEQELSELARISGFKYNEFSQLT